MIGLLLEKLLIKEKQYEAVFLHQHMDGLMVLFKSSF